MPAFLKTYGDTEGPLGFPMRDAAAKTLDELLKAHPDAEHVRAVVEKATTETMDGERSDVAWIQTEAIDLQKEVILAAGFRDDLFASNPIVTLNHSYYRPPVGKSLWRKRVKDGERRGVKAKTVYPPRPDEWPAGDVWDSDSAWALVKSGLMNGKSIGFLTLKAHAPTAEEIRKNPAWTSVKRIVDEWMLLEYACCWCPINPEAVTDEISKSAKALGLELPEPPPQPEARSEPSPLVVFTPLEQYQAAIDRVLSSLKLNELIHRPVSDAIDRLRGRV